MIYALNGSPRKDWNTVTLLEHALQGAQRAGAQTRLVHLYEMNYKGCVSCFACKRKNGRRGHCAMRDDLSPLLEELKTAQGLILGSPIYWWDITACMRAFLERFFFSNMLYNRNKRWVFPKSMPSAFILTFGSTHDFMQPKLERFSEIEMNLSDMLGLPMQTLYSDDAMQFEDYSLYEADRFDGAAKKKHHDTAFAADCKKAEKLGAKMAAGH